VEGSGSVAGEAAEEMRVRRAVVLRVRAWSWKARGEMRALRGRAGMVAALGNMVAMVRKQHDRQL